MISITLPFPSSDLSGHAKGHWRKKSEATKKHRNWARNATLEKRKAFLDSGGEIKLRVTFTPPSRRGDKLNFPNRMKPYFDGIADGLGVNDKRFLIPEYICNEPEKPGKVVVEVIG